MNRRSFLCTSVASIAAVASPAVLAAERNFNHYVIEQADAGQKTYQVKVGDNWSSVFGARAELARFYSRQNIQLEPGQHILLLPKQVADKMLLAPLSNRLDVSQRRQTIVISPLAYAWGLYISGELFRWGPAVCGGDWCADVNRACRTPTGHFRVSELAGPNRRSTRYPREEAAEGRGALMPYFMRITDYGVGLHARYIRGRHETHGCIGLFYDDARWLNEYQRISGTVRVQVERYS